MVNNVDALAIAAAKKLATKYRDKDIVQKTETILKHGPPKVKRAATRAVEIAGIDPIALAILIVHCVHLGLTWSENAKNKAALVKLMKSDPNLPTTGTTGNQVADVIQSVSNEISKSIKT